MSYAEIPLNEVKLGMYIRLPLKWWKHPFLRNTFQIQSSEEIDQLKGLGLKTIEYDPEKSDRDKGPGPGGLTSLPVQPSSLVPGRSPKSDSRLGGPPRSDSERFKNPFKSPSSTVEGESLDPRFIQDGRVKGQKTEDDIPAQEGGDFAGTQPQTPRREIQFLEERRKNLIKKEKEYDHALTQVSQIMKSLETDTEAGVASAQGLMDHVVDTMLQDEETIVHLLNLKEKDAYIYFHSLNVSILSLLLGKRLGLSKSELKELGMGALFHDVGKQKIPKKILLKKAPLTQAEKKFIQLHPRYGLSLLAGKPNVSPKVLQVLYQHHEKCNGKGYPHGLKEEQISYFAKITAIVDTYDNITNHEEGSSFTPHEALSHIYTHLQQDLSAAILTSFIKCLGVYPPGTLVELSDGGLGMVITTDRDQSMRPTVILYDPDVPRAEPLILNLSEHEADIVQCLRPSQVKPEIVNYLQPGRMVGFFVGSITSPKPMLKGLL